MRIAVYCIAHNEARHLARWAQSSKDADVQLVVDTGSTDGTAAEAMKVGALVHSIHVNPWRFDDARNASLALIPKEIDLCIALDADEVLAPGWRQLIESIPADVTRPRYHYVWSWHADGTPDKTYGGDKIHARNGYRWKHPVHEVLKPSGKEKQQWVEGLEIHHHPDPSKSRGQYLPLLAQAIAEDPHDDRNAFYYARELLLQGQPEQARAQFFRHLALPSARWAPERAASMRYLAQLCPMDRRTWLLRAIAEAPDRRESHVALAQFEHDRGNWPACYAAAMAALAIKQRPRDYISDGDSWGALPHDLAAISAHWMGLKDGARKHGAEAVKLSPMDQRLRANQRFYQ